MSAPVIGGKTWKKPLPESATRVGWMLVAGGLLLSAAAYLLDPQRSAFNNIILFLFVASLAAGSIFLIALEYLTGAVWSVPMRRVNEFLAALTPLVPLLALPLLLNMRGVFVWTHPDAAFADPVIGAKEAYLNTTFFVARFLIVIVAWLLFYVLMTRNSLRQDATGDARLTTANNRLGAIFMPVFAVTITVTAVDWAMSLEPHWYSTIFGVYYFSGTVVAAVAAATLVIVLLNERGYFPSLRRDHYYSLGALMFAFLNFWAYIAFSQFLLIWYANLPEETFWFMKRWVHGWQYVSVLLIVMQFAVPYAVLLPQDAKMDPKRLKLMAIWLLIAHYLDMYWLVMPTCSPSVTLSWSDLAFPLLGVGLVIVTLGSRMRRHNLVPVGDPKLERGLSFHI